MQFKFRQRNGFSEVLEAAKEGLDPEVVTFF